MVPCPKCDGPLMRVEREGFMEEVVYPWTGRFPWVCSFCKVRVLVKLRHTRNRRENASPREGEAD